MKLILLTKRSLVTLGLSLMIGVTAATVAITSTVKAVQTAAEPRKIPVYRVESDKKQVAISFDAAWGNEQTEDLLKILDEHKVKATFFLVGKWVDDFPDDVKSIAAHGNDIGSWEGYDGNEQYNYYNSVGYHFYCNVDGSVPYWVQITDHYVRQGRIDVDGYRLWLAQNGEDSSLSELVDLTGIFNQDRPTPVVANGQG